MQYRRAYIPGATYFFTVNILERDKNLLTDHIDLLRQTIRYVKNQHPFQIDAMVILPDHLHTLWTLPEKDSDFSLRWRLIKSTFSRGLAKNERIKPSRKHKSERGIWQRRFWEHVIRDENDFNRHVDYIHINPVKHQYVKRPADWPYSSIHKFIRQGLVDINWGCKTDFSENDFGERIVF